jgi:DNA polymerase IV
VFSVDEAFLDISRCMHLYQTPIDAAKLTRQIIQEQIGLPCSIGLSGNKTMAKYAAELKKPNGFTVIPPWEAESALADVPVTKLCGIGENTARFLAQHNVIYCKDMAKLPIGVLGKRFGNLGRKMWLMCQGKDPEPVCTTVTPAKSLGHGKILPPKTTDPAVIKVHFLHMAEKVATRLRYNNMYASNFFIGMRAQNWGWLALKHKIPNAINDGKLIYHGCEKLLQAYPDPGVIRQVQVTALNPQANLKQLSLFATAEVDNNELLNMTIDSINQKFGDCTITGAAILCTKNN